MIRPGFLSSADRLELEACVRRQREDHGIARRANAILLLDDGKSCQEISDFLYLDDDTIRGWHKSYLQDGWDALAFDGWKGGQSRMTQAQEVALCAWLEARFCRSTVEIGAHVAAECGLNYSHSGCIKFLARLGFEYRKPKSLPRVASAQMQAAFIAFYERLMRELPAGGGVDVGTVCHHIRIIGPQSNGLGLSLAIGGYEPDRPRRHHAQRGDQAALHSPALK